MKIQNQNYRRCEIFTIFMFLNVVFTFKNIMYSEHFWANCIELRLIKKEIKSNISAISDWQYIVSWSAIHSENYIRRQYSRLWVSEWVKK